MNKRLGFSLIEVMVAIAIVATIAMVSARSFLGIKNSEIGMREGDICKSYVDSAFKNVDVYGMMPTLVDSSVVSSTSGNSKAPTGIDIKGIHSEAIFPLRTQALVIFTDSSQLTKLNTPSLLGGTIAMLNGLYNNHSTTCQTSIISSPGASTAIDGLLPPKPAGLDASGLTAQMDIVPYDVVSGVPLATGCDTIKTPASGKLVIAPKGLALTGTQSTLKQAGLGDGIRNDLGFQVTVGATFKTADGRPHSCSAVHKYAYPAELSGVPAPTASISYVNAGSPLPAYAPLSVTLTVGTTGAKPGTVLMCQDVSVTANPGDDPGGTNGNPYITSFNPPIPPVASHEYAPCELVTLCGKTQRDNSGNSQASVPSTGYQNFSISSTWRNSGPAGPPNRIPPDGCFAKVNVVAVDMAGNISGITQATQMLGALQNCQGGYQCINPGGGACGPTGGHREYFHTIPAQYQGAACPHPDGWWDGVSTCALASCPINCVGNWGACSAACAGTQTYTITTPAQFGGSICPATNGATQACNGVCPPAPVNCVGAWGACSASCGGGTQTYYVTTNAANGGASCPVVNGASQACNTTACATPVPVPTAAPTAAPTATPTTGGPCDGAASQFSGIAGYTCTYDVTIASPALYTCCTPTPNPSNGTCVGTSPICPTMPTPAPMYTGHKACKHIGEACTSTEQVQNSVGVYVVDLCGCVPPAQVSRVFNAFTPLYHDGAADCNGGSCDYTVTCQAGMIAATFESCWGGPAPLNCVCR